MCIYIYILVIYIYIFISICHAQDLGKLPFWSAWSSTFIGFLKGPVGTTPPHQPRNIHNDVEAKNHVRQARDQQRLGEHPTVVGDFPRALGTCQLGLFTTYTRWDDPKKKKKLPKGTLLNATCTYITVYRICKMYIFGCSAMVEH